METTFKINKHIDKKGNVTYDVVITKENISWTQIIDTVKEFL